MKVKNHFPGFNWFIIMTLLSFQGILSGRIIAQDTIYLQNGTRLNVKITEIDPEEIRYQVEGIPALCEYSIKKDKAVKIVYRNGQEKYPNSNAPVGPNMCPPYRVWQNQVKFYIFDLIYKDVTLSVERLSENSKLGIEFPLCFGFGYDDAESKLNLNDIIYSGVSLNYYPFGKKPIQFVTGMSFRLGVARSYPDDQLPGNFMTGISTITYTKMLLNNGLVFNINGRLFISSLLSGGTIYLNSDSRDYPEGFNFTAYFTVACGFRF